MRREIRRPARTATAAFCLAACLTLSESAPAQAGPSTKDSALQQAVTRSMNGKSGTAVVIEIASGKVLAAFHPETAARRLALPGSAIKPFALLALLAGQQN